MGIIFEVGTSRLNTSVVCDVNIAVNGPYRADVVNSEHP